MPPRHRQRIVLSAFWLVSLALAAARVAGAPRALLIAFVAFAPPAIWLALGAQGRDRLRTLRLGYPLWRALRRGELTLFFQPKAEALGGRVRSVEALVRWRHPRRGILLPADFLPAIHDGLWLRRFNRFVLREAIHSARAWELCGRPLRMSINVSPDYVIHPEFVGFLRAECERSGVDRSLLRVEVTESPLLDRDADAFCEAVKAVRALGIGVSIDDFGMGESSLARLVDLPIDVLKIDRRFTAGLSCDLKAHKVVRTAIELAHALGMTVVAEGVETHEQWVQLTAWGCDLVQGFKLQRPVSAEDLWRWLDDSGHDIAELGPRIAAVRGHRRRFERQAAI